MATAISIKNLTKAYKIYSSSLAQAMAAFRKKDTSKKFVALDDLSVDFPRGEVIAILGKNGSGKSTLLKLITGVATPTSGTIEYDGRISAMLELTSGFDSDLTGIENIYLRALALGIPREEIAKKEQEIIEFADIGDHINQPVRTYSSGMRARLGFAVSASVDPDILIIDEVLAVGDDTFKLKCIEKMKSFRQQGKTILFVSHSLGTVKAFCTKGMWLHKGKLKTYDDIGPVVQKYEDFLRKERAKQRKKNKSMEVEVPLVKSDILQASGFCLKNSAGEECNTFAAGEDVFFEFTYNVKQPINDLMLSYVIRNAEDIEIFGSNKQDPTKKLDQTIGFHHVEGRLKSPDLIPGMYKFSGEMWDSESVFRVLFAGKRKFYITQKEFIGSGITPIFCDISVEDGDGSSASNTSADKPTQNPPKGTTRVKN